MRLAVLAAFAATALMLGRATAGPVSVEQQENGLANNDDLISSTTGNNDVYESAPNEEDLGDGPGADEYFEDEEEYDETVEEGDSDLIDGTDPFLIPNNGTDPFMILLNVPTNAPPDFWMPKDQQVKRPPPPPGNHYEFMYCDKAFDQGKKQCGGTCNYVMGTIESGEVTLLTPRSRCIVGPCDMRPFQLCQGESYLSGHDVKCRQASHVGGPLGNGMCIMHGHAHAIRVRA